MLDGEIQRGELGKELLRSRLRELWCEEDQAQVAALFSLDRKILCRLRMLGAIAVG